jgi:hypothetical protein
MKQLVLSSNNLNKKNKKKSQLRSESVLGLSIWRRTPTKSLVWSVRLVGMFIIALLWGSVWIMHVRANEQMAEAIQMCVNKYPYITKKVEIVSGSTFGVLLEQAEVEAADISAIFVAAEHVYDLSKIRVGHTIELEYERESQKLRSLVYQIDTEELLQVIRTDDSWLAERRLIEYDIRLRTVEGAIESSLYAAALAQGLDDRAIIALADVFQWELDFVLDVRKGDRFKFIYEERFLAGHYVMPGRVFAAKFINVDKPHYAFWFEAVAGKGAHFNEKGESVQKMFLKAPVAFKYISSGFTTGLRYVEAFNVSTGHRAIDYAAPLGTPVRTVGDGTVISAGWNGPYGRFISIRHNGTYVTNYAHLSRIAVQLGQKVTQGQTIGNVGSTGFSTGPHLHYEMVKHGAKINPLREDFPGIDPVPTEKLREFLQVVKEWQPQLD